MLFTVDRLATRNKQYLLLLSDREYLCNFDTGNLIQLKSVIYLFHFRYFM